MRDFKFLAILFLLFLLVSVTEVSAQEGARKSIDMPVVLTRMDTYTDPTSQKVEPTREREDLVKDFGLDNFQVQVGGVQALVQGVAVDKGPKRIVFVLDASDSVSKTEWEVEIFNLQMLLGYARSTDKFAVVFVGAAVPTNEFLLHSATKGLLGKLRNARPPSTDSGTRIYDAILEAARCLEPSQFGDMVILDGRVVDSGSKTALGDLVKVFMKNRIRFIGFSSSLESIPRPDLASLCAATGCFLESSRTWDYEFLYEVIAEPYRLTIATPARADPAVLDIKLVPGSKKKKVEGIIFHYPRFISP